VNVVYRELRQLASSFMQRERPGHTLQTTALVHEAYLRLCGTGPVVDVQNRGHFFALLARQMRRILVDHARTEQAAKRWGGLKRVTLGEVEQPGQVARGDDLLALDEALERLGELDARAASVVELRYFGGLSEQETARALNVSRSTVKRDWEFARTWLISQLS